MRRKDLLLMAGFFLSAVVGGVVVKFADFDVFANQGKVKSSQAVVGSVQELETKGKEWQAPTTDFIDGVSVVAAPTTTGQILKYNAGNTRWQVGTEAGKQLFTASGTFTAPSGVTKVWVSMSGGGGGGAGYTDENIAGSPGGNSSFVHAGGTLTCAGGFGAPTSAAGGAPGGTGGARGRSVTVTYYGYVGGYGGGSIFGAGGPTYYPGGGYGGGGGGAVGGGGGGAHAVMAQELTVVPGSAYTVTVGAGGAGAVATYPGGDGAPGFCLVE